MQHCVKRHSSCFLDMQKLELHFSFPLSWILVTFIPHLQFTASFGRPWRETASQRILSMHLMASATQSWEFGLTCLALRNVGFTVREARTGMMSAWPKLFDPGILEGLLPNGRCPWKDRFCRDVRMGGCVGIGEVLRRLASTYQVRLKEIDFSDVSIFLLKVQQISIYFSDRSMPREFFHDRDLLDMDGVNLHRYQRNLQHPRNGKAVVATLSFHQSPLTIN